MSEHRTTQTGTMYVMRIVDLSDFGTVLHTSVHYSRESAEIFGKEERDKQALVDEEWAKYVGVEIDELPLMQTTLIPPHTKKGEDYA